MKQRDLTESFYDTMINLLFKYIKDLINWDRIQSFVPRKLIWYNDKKKCQLLLAMADVNSLYSTKYYSKEDDVAASIRDSIYYLDNFRPSRSVMYMKAYRKQYLVDIFDVFAQTYDKVLRSAKYSHEVALSVIKEHEADLLMAAANSLKNNYQVIIDSSATEEEYLNNNQFIMDLCEELQSFTNLFSFNCKRASSIVISMLFDIQALYDIAFNPTYKTFQNDKYDEFEIIKKKKLIGEIITSIMKTVHDVIESAYTSESKFDKESQSVIKIHKLAIPEEDNDRLELTIECCDPMIINT